MKGGEEILVDERAALPRFREDLVAGRLWQLIVYLQSRTSRKDLTGKEGL
jgi:hypothetical protein